jgi:hypothetical protein
MREEPDFTKIDECNGAPCPRCGEWEEGLDLLVHSMCACCESDERRFFDD